MSFREKQIKLLLNDLLKSYFPNALGAFITGSYLDNTFNNESDIDFWLISNQHDYIFNETIKRDEYKIQIMHIPFFKVNEMLWLDFSTNNGMYLGAFAKGHIVKDTGNFLRDLIERCQKIFHSGPLLLGQRELLEKKLIILNKLSDFKGNKSSEESMVILNDLLNATLLFYIHLNRKWTCNGGRYLVREVKKLDTLIYGELFGCYKRYFTSNQKEPIVKLVTKYMDAFQSTEIGYSKFSNLIEVKEPYLLIQIYGVSNFYDFFKKEITSIYQLLQNENISVFTIRTRAVGDSNFNHESLYINIMAESPERLNNLIIPILNENLLRKEKNYKINYPVNIDWSLLLGDKRLIQPLGLWQSTLYLKLNDIGLNESISFLAGLEIFKGYYVLIFASDKNLFTQFLDFLFDNWLVQSYDTGNFYRIDQLLIEKERVLEKYVHQFVKQSKIVREIFLDENYSIIDVNLKKQLFLILSKIDSLNNESLYLTVSVTPDNNKTLNLNLQWNIYQNVMKTILSGLLISEAQMSYLPFCIQRLFVN